MARASTQTAERVRWEALEQRPPTLPLFDAPDERVRHPEFRDLEFVHVRAKTIINEVPAAARVPFRYTINAYRGCSHACSYCLAGHTPIYMADGSTKPLAEIKAGDRIYGTERRGDDRRCVTTEVLDHWSTVKPAYRVLLEDGTELIASGDHRFLSDRGWRHVSGAEQGQWPRAELTTEDRLVAVGPAPSGTAAARRSLEGLLVGSDSGRRIVDVRHLGIELTLYDITTGTGDFIADGVVSHNCFARPTHTYLNLDAGRDFERVIVVKTNAVELLRAELHPRRWPGDSIAMGTNTDPYQRCEGRYELTRGIVAALAERGNPFSILTKSALVTRDLDLIAEAARSTDVSVSFSVGTLDPEVWRASEPGTPHPLRRLEALARFAEAGVRTGVLIAPILPGISDSETQIEEVVRGAIDAGAASITPILLHLRPGVREEYLGWLSAYRPDLLPSYERTYHRAYASSEERVRVARLVRRLVERHGGPRPANGASRRHEARPRPKARTEARQLSLGI